MQTYKLYLESGPRKKKTMVHVLDLVEAFFANYAP
jgi:Cdc6-like AAA superfamily ATPase